MAPIENLLLKSQNIRSQVGCPAVFDVALQFVLPGVVVAPMDHYFHGCLSMTRMTSIFCANGTRPTIDRAELEALIDITAAIDLYVSKIASHLSYMQAVIDLFLS